MSLPERHDHCERPVWGIDSAAHRGALAGKKRTIAILGCGLDVVYPSENGNLFMEIAENGAVITEFITGTPTSAPNFPARNRIISGISMSVVVVEAGEKSGSLITARIALEQEREVVAVPGNINAAGSRETHQLIKQGAKLIENVKDILDEILPQIENSTRRHVPNDKNDCREIVDTSKMDHAVVMNTLSDTEKAALKYVSSKKVDVDTLIFSSGFRAGDVLNILLNQELRGLVEQLPGKIYVRKE